MNCAKCGQPLVEGAKFCPNCGTRVEQPQQQVNAFCSTCGAKLEPAAKFCPSCGVKVEQAAEQPVNHTGTTTTTTAARTTTATTTMTAAKTATGTLLAQLNVSMYEGTPTVGIAKATGPLSVYDDRLEFKKTFGNALGGAFGLIGMAAAKSKVKDDPVDIYPVSQISGLRVGKYGGVYNTLVVVMRDGGTKSFCPAMPGSSEPQNIIDRLQPYLR